MKELSGRTVLITGAASGIGRATATAFARKGCVVLLADIDKKGMAETADMARAAGAACRSYSMDVADGERVREVAGEVLSEFGGLDVLVNNAGVFVWGEFIDLTQDDWEWITGVNYWGPVNTMRAFLPAMIESGRGHVVNVASSGGLVTIPAISAYCATKFALVGLGEALQYEVWRTGVWVTTVCPGSTRTPIIGNIRVRGLNREFLERRVFPVANRYPAEKVAERIVDAVERDRRLVVLTAEVKAMYFLKRVSPALLHAVVRPFGRLFSKLAGE